MLPRADLGTRPSATIEAPTPIAASTATRQETYGRLARFFLGQQMQAEVMSRFDDNTFLVRVADTPARMALPQGTQVGDQLSMTLMSQSPRPTFLLNAPPGSSTARLSSAGRLINAVLQFVQPEGDEPTVEGSRALLPSPAVLAERSAVPKMASALQDALAHSGVFYESHLAEWIGGERPTAQLLREPQASVLRDDAAASGALPASGDTDVSPTAQSLPSPGGAQVLPAAENTQTTPEGMNLTAAATAGSPATADSAPATATDRSLSATADGTPPTVPNAPAGDLLPAGTDLPEQAPPPPPARAAGSAAPSEAADATYGPAPRPAPGQAQSPLPDIGRPLPHDLTQRLSSLHRTIQMLDQFAAAPAGRPAPGLSAQPPDMPAARMAESPAWQLIPSNPEITDADILVPQASRDTIAAEAARFLPAQLHALEQARVHWQGELFPGMPIDWIVSEDAPEGSSDRREQSEWHSAVRFELPSLGEISATVVLSGEHVRIEVRTASDDVAETLRTHAPALSLALEAAGTTLDSLLVKRDEQA